MHYRNMLSAAALVVFAAQGVPQPLHAATNDFNPFQEVTDVQFVYTGAPILPLGAADSDETAVFVVLLKDDPVVEFRGNREFQAAPRDQRGKPNLRSENARNYRAHLRGKQDRVIANGRARLNRDPEVVQRYTEVLNGVAVRVSGHEARVIAKDPEVAAVIRSEAHSLATFAGPAWIGADGIWEGPAGLQSQGEGTLIGIIDSGINPASPSFAAIDPTDGYQHQNPYGSGNFVGVCNPSHPQYQPAYQCNDKLVGAYHYLSGHGTFPNQGAFDENGHGSHVGSTAGGNKVSINFNGADLDLSGVAPRANIINYRVCGGAGTTCFTHDSAAAIDQAILDGVDVLNFSVGGGTNPAADLASLAFLRAADAGVFVAAAAGNFNPNSAGTVSHRGAWMTTVASLTHNGLLAHPVSVTGPAPVAGAPQNMGGVRGTGPVMHDVGFTTVGTGSQGKGQGQQQGQGQGLNAGKTEYRWAGSFGDLEGCSPFPAGAFNGAVALIRRGSCDFVVKVDNAEAAGAVAVVVYNNAPGLPIVMGALEATTVPAVMVSDVHGAALLDWLNAKGTAHLSLSGTAVASFSDGYADIMALSSGRGPAGDVLKPDIAAPGASVVAAYVPNADSYAQIGGTSMASPHVAGAAALLRAIHPDWSPLEIKSALMTTAHSDGVRQNNAVTPANPFDIGGGRAVVDRAARAGLVLHETRANFEAGNAGGDLTTLNIASFANRACDMACSWTRTLRSTRNVGTNWTFTANSLSPGLNVSATSALSIAAGGNGVLNVSADSSGMAVGTWGFFEVIASDTSGQSPDQRFVGAVHRPAPIQQGSYVVGTNSTSATCAAPFANVGGYVDLGAFGITLQTGLAGDTVGFTSFGGIPTWMHGAFYDTGLHFRDDGFAFVISGADTTPGTTPWQNQPIPNSGQPNNLLAALWHDWMLVGDAATDRGVRLATATFDGSPWLIADFRRVAPFGQPATAAISYQIAMRRNPSTTASQWDIVFAYNHVNGTHHLSNTTIGVENLHGNQGTQFAFNDANLSQVVNGRAICFKWVPAN